jgi:hypothetical protein
MMTGRYAPVTTSVSVINDGADGQAAVIRAAGTPAPMPFIENLVGGVLHDAYEDVPTAIDYVLEPDADHVDVYIAYRSPRLEPEEQGFLLHGFMFTPRMPAWSSGVGFETEHETLPYLAFVDDDGASWAYEVPGRSLDPGINASGFMSMFSSGFELAACGETRRHHARLTIGGPGVDGLVRALARKDQRALRAIAGTVMDADGGAAGVRVHAASATLGVLTRTTTDATGAFTLHVPDGEAVELTAYRRGDLVVGPVAVPGDAASAMISMAPSGFVRVAVADAATGAPLPSRIQVLPAGASTIPSLPAAFGEPLPTDGRLHVEYAMTGERTLRVPVGEWEVVASRGYEYELDRRTVTVAAGETVDVAASLARVVDTAGVQCADFHIHTHRSNDSGDDAREKLMSAVADGLEIPVRSEHEYVDTFQPLIEELGLQAFAYGVGSIEMTSMQVWGHMGVVPLERDPTAVNGGAPLWETFPQHDSLDVPVEIMNPVDVFEAVRARPEQPTIIINHPMGGTNYFDYAELDVDTGLVGRPEVWDEAFTVVEVFNDAGWPNGVVPAWLSLLARGRRVFAVGSSDSHGIKSSPVGYPRTCMRLGTDDPSAVDPDAVRDAIAQGHATVSGGIYVEASVGAAGPGDEVSGVGAEATVHVRVQAASWIEADAIEVVVDGVTAETLAIDPADADPDNPVIRFERDFAIPVADGGSFVIFAVTGDALLEPVHPGRRAFGVTNPTFLTP